MIHKLTRAVQFENKCVKFCISFFATKVALFYIIHLLCLPDFQIGFVVYDFTLMLVVMWWAECNPGAWKNQQEQTVGMRCSPSAVTTTPIGTWNDFDSSHNYDNVCC